MEIEIPQEEVESKFAEVYKEIRKVAKVPGFRPGKAPEDIIEKHYKSEAEEEVLKSLISSSYDGAVRELKISPIELPQIVDIKLERGKPFIYKAEVDTRPDIKIKKYKGLKVNKNKLNIGNAEIEKALSELLELNAKFVSAETRNIADGVYTVCDLKCFADGKEIFKKDALWLSVNENMGIKDLHKGMLGMKKDEEKGIVARLPENYPDNTLANKDVMYKVKIRDVKEKKLPALDDNFAKDLGKNDLAELKDAVKKDLSKRSEISIKEDMKKQIIDQLIENSSFEAPESVVNKQLESMVSDTKDRMLYQGIKKGDIESNVSKIEERLRPQAAREVKALFLLNEIAKTENVQVEPAEVDKAIEIIANQVKKDKKKLLEEYEEKDLLQNIIEQIREEKVMEFLLKEAEITEK